MTRDGVALTVILMALVLGGIAPPEGAEAAPARRDQADNRRKSSARVDYRPATRTHLDHAPFFEHPFARPEEVTRACLACHESAASDFMKTSHWQWLGEEVVVPGHASTPTRIGKKNLLNNFCISISGNYAQCTRCHAGYGWADADFDFTREEAVDCLVCHERTGTYLKGDAGVPGPGIDLLAAARSVSWPRRENCTVCHAYGGGGQGVKHGDLDSSLENPAEGDDVHMGRLGFLCIDCHRTEDHRLAGRSFSVGVENQGGVACADCHRTAPHADQRLNGHLDAVSCEACHIPAYARKLPTKTWWDWSKAGDPTRADDEHAYLRIKGEFLYDHDITPEYFWFNETMERYLLGDPVDPGGETAINRPLGDRRDPKAKIHPFKVHRARQPYDRERNVLIPPLTAGEGGYWQTFEWDSSLRLGAAAAGVEYSGSYGFADTRMYWPLSHQVAPKAEALTCEQCHGPAGRMRWSDLGYDGDPIETGGGR